LFTVVLFTVALFLFTVVLFTVGLLGRFSFVVGESTMC